MNTTCDKGPVIDAIQKNTAENNSQIQNIAKAVTALTGQFSQCVIELRGMYGDDREATVRLSHVEKDVEILFTQQRKMEETIAAKLDNLSIASSIKFEKLEKHITNKLDPLTTWKNKVEGGWWMIRAIPITGAVVSVMAALFSLGAFE